MRSRIGTDCPCEESSEGSGSLGHLPEGPSVPSIPNSYSLLEDHFLVVGTNMVHLMIPEDGKQDDSNDGANGAEVS